MTRIAALALTVLCVLWARRIAAPVMIRRPGMALVLGFTLVGAWLSGDVPDAAAPQLTGKLPFGILMGPYLGNVITSGMASQLAFVNGIATTLIALIAGLTLNVERPGTRLGPIARTTGWMIGVRLSASSLSDG
ncbi:MAG: hypothetical protein U0Q11_22395 [Vicinamibacterales bacterium]